MEIDLISKSYIVRELKQRGIVVKVDELDQLKDELVPFAKGRLDYRIENGGISEKEMPYALIMAKYFNLSTDLLQ